MALLEERYHAGLGTKGALRLALDCCRAMQQQQQQQAGNDGGEEEGHAESNAAVDVALVVPEGVRLMERVSPPESLLELLSGDDDEDEDKGTSS